MSFVITSTSFFLVSNSKEGRCTLPESEGSDCSAKTRVHLWSVEPLPRVLLLPLVDHDADDDASDAGQKSEEEEEEQLDAGHGARLRVVDVIPRGLEVARRRLDLGPVLRVGGLRLVELVQLHRHDVVAVRQVTWKLRRWNIYWNTFLNEYLKIAAHFLYGALN